MIRVGDKVCQKLSYRMSNEEDRRQGMADKPMTGTVVWVHPRGRFYVVEFTFDLGNIRECYPFVR